jgi:methyl-accepting chemotaxis protein
MNLVKQSLVICIGVLLALIGLQGAQSLWQITRLADATEHIVAGDKLAAEAQLVWARFLDAEEVFRQITAFVDVTENDRLHDAFGRQAEALRKQMAALQAGSGGALQDQAAAVSGKLGAWLDLATRHVAPGGVTELPSYHRLDAARAALQTDIDSLVQRSAALAERTAAASRERADAAWRWTLAELTLAVALGGALGWHAMRSLHRQLGADASEVARVANAVADGDLTLALAIEGLPQGSVMAAAARMQCALRETVARVRGISGHLADGVDEIASGNNDLRRRTEEQAAAIEKTAATMAELDGTVRTNADGAADASRLAEEASAVAARGGVEVERAVLRMRGINDSAKKIADIIGVIDGIAFQTNILALNAAVEAARAGTQGRGFAVVAGEVRGLAQRCGTASHEIRALITDSVQRVEEGGALVDQAGQTMQTVVQAIGRVAAVTAAIRTASAQQSSGVADVGHSVTQLDRATQQNATLAEQSAKAAESLKSQGRQLVEAVSFFKVQAGA